MMMNLRRILRGNPEKIIHGKPVGKPNPHCTKRKSFYKFLKLSSKLNSCNLVPFSYDIILQKYIIAYLCLILCFLLPCDEFRIS
jgi:hypothetical protein